MNVHEVGEPNFSRLREKKPPSPNTSLMLQVHSPLYFKAQECTTGRTALRVHPLERIVYHLVSGFIQPVEQICQHDTGY